MGKTFVFIDESGNHDLDTKKNGVSDYFLVLALVIDESNLNELSKNLKDTIERHFQSGEMKSSGIKDKDNHSRRVRIINEILSLDFKFYLLALDKNAVERDGGLKYKKSFIKFVNKLIYSSLISSFDDLEINADSHGDARFQESFFDYIMELGTGDLFKHQSLNLVDSKDVPLVQLADFLVGSFAKIYENKKVNSTLTDALKNIVNSKSIGLVEWPSRNRVLNASKEFSSRDDKKIYIHSLNKADSFIDKKSGFQDYETTTQLIVLNFLLFKDRFPEERDYVSTQEILSHLNERGFKNVGEQTLRSSIIAKLRDQGVIIASSNKGYKIPRSAEDLTDYVSRVNGQIVPLLTRLNKARNSYLLATKGDFDLLEVDAFRHLREFIEILPDTILIEELNR